MAAAVANAEHREGLTQSRARVIAAADEARRRLQRDVHDGAQQRLVHTILMLKLARESASSGGDVTDLLADALSNAEEANRQLRDIVRGILPAALTRNGLAAGIESLVCRHTDPVDLSLDHSTIARGRRDDGVLHRRRSDHQRSQTCASHTSRSVVHAVQRVRMS